MADETPSDHETLRICAGRAGTAGRPPTAGHDSQTAAGLSQWTSDRRRWSHRATHAPRTLIRLAPWWLPLPSPQPFGSLIIPGSILLYFEGCPKFLASLWNLSLNKPPKQDNITHGQQPCFFLDSILLSRFRRAPDLVDPRFSSSPSHARLRFLHRASRGERL